LDDGIKERIDHNLKYNDDTIFDNFSIFQQLSHEEFPTEHINIIRPPEEVKQQVGEIHSDPESVTLVIQAIQRHQNEDEEKDNLINIEDLAKITNESDPSLNEDLMRKHPNSGQIAEDNPNNELKPVGRFPDHVDSK